MSILVRYAPSSLNAEQYDRVSERLQSAGNWPPSGLQAHVCFGSGESLRVSEIWESREQLEVFGDVLMPILRDEGIDVESTQPEFFEIHALLLYEASIPPPGSA